MGEQNQNCNTTSTPSHSTGLGNVSACQSLPLAQHCTATPRPSVHLQSWPEKERQGRLDSGHRRTAVLPVPGELLGCWPEDHHEASDFLSFHQPSLSLVGVMGLGIRTLRYADKAWLRPASPFSTRATGRILGPSPGSYSGHAGFSNIWVRKAREVRVCVCVHAYKTGW